MRAVRSSGLPLRRPIRESTGAKTIRRCPLASPADLRQLGGGGQPRASRRRGPNWSVVEPQRTVHPAEAGVGEQYPRRGQRVRAGRQQRQRHRAARRAQPDHAGDPPAPQALGRQRQFAHAARAQAVAEGALERGHRSHPERRVGVGLRIVVEARAGAVRDQQRAGRGRAAGGRTHRAAQPGAIARRRREVAGVEGRPPAGQVQARRVVGLQHHRRQRLAQHQSIARGVERPARLRGDRAQRGEPGAHEVADAVGADHHHAPCAPGAQPARRDRAGEGAAGAGAAHRESRRAQPRRERRRQPRRPTRVARLLREQTSAPAPGIAFGGGQHHQFRLGAVQGPARHRFREVQQGPRQRPGALRPANSAAKLASRSPNGVSSA